MPSPALSCFASSGTKATALVRQRAPAQEARLGGTGRGCNSPPGEGRGAGQGRGHIGLLSLPQPSRASWSGRPVGRSRFSRKGVPDPDLDPEPPTALTPGLDPELAVVARARRFSAAWKRKGGGRGAWLLSQVPLLLPGPGPLLLTDPGLLMPGGCLGGPRCPGPQCPCLHQGALCPCLHQGALCRHDHCHY